MSEANDLTAKRSNLQQRSGLPTLVGLTGGIGSGKSTIAAELAKRGYPVYDTDREAKRIIVTNPAVRSQVETLFGSEVFDGDTYITSKVAAQVFANPDLLLRLNAIVHPAVRFDLEHWVNIQTSEAKQLQTSAAVQQRSGLTSNCEALSFVESAILYESGLNDLCDKVVYIDAPEDIRIARTVARDHCTAEQAQARIDAQSSNAKLLADLILSNDGTTSIPSLTDTLLHSFV